MGSLSVGWIESAVFVAVFLLLALAVLRPTLPSRRRWHPRRGVAADRRPGSKPRPTIHRSIAVAPPTDPAEQLRAVMEAPFTAKRVLSRSEAGVLSAAEAGLGWRVMAQVALGEVLASTDEAAFRAINAKRVDLLVVSATHRPLAAIEYQGQGHWQSSAPARNASKKEALRRAGIGYIEITHADGPADVRHAIGKVAMSVAGTAEMPRLAGRGGASASWQIDAGAA